MPPNLLELWMTLWFFANALIRYHAHKQRYTTHRSLHACSSYLHYFEQIICWCQNFTLQSSSMSLLFKNYWLVEVTYLLIRFNKTSFFPWKTKNTDRYGVNKHKNKHEPPLILCKRQDWKGLHSLNSLHEEGCLTFSKLVKMGRWGGGGGGGKFRGGPKIYGGGGGGGGGGGVWKF